MKNLENQSSDQSLDQEIKDVSNNITIAWGVIAFVNMMSIITKTNPDPVLTTSICIASWWHSKLFAEGMIEIYRKFMK